RDYSHKAQTYLTTLCSVKPNRRVGSSGNRAATEFFAQTTESWGYTIDATPFPCLDFQSGEPSLSRNDIPFAVHPSPYSLGCEATAELKTVSTVEELEECTCHGQILLLRDAITAEQLMPKNFVFYNPEHHQRIYALLEEKRPAAIITATRRNPELVGALYPFPMIEDGDFDIPSVYCTDTVGESIAAHTGRMFRLKIHAQRIPATAYNVVARKNPTAKAKIVVCAHIDAYGDAPGASDNASGTVVELLLAEMLAEYSGHVGIEIVAFNGEDHYSAGGQMDYLRRYGKAMEEMLLAINIDDVGYVHGKTAYSLYECPDKIEDKADAVFGSYDGIIRGEQWYQGDHMIFAQKGKAAMAITAERFPELMATVTHTPRDTPEIVDCDKLVEIADALHSFITQF
ncbi:MAG: M28 family peptidase, partial [Anaerolineae bacterium]